MFDKLKDILFKKETKEIIIHKSNEVVLYKNNEVVLYDNDSYIVEEKKRGYDSALVRVSRLMGGIFAPNTDASTEILAALEDSRNVASELVRNNPTAKRIIDVWTTKLIGYGITVTPKDLLLKKLWTEWALTNLCDSEGRLNIYGQQELAIRSMIERGEVLIRMRPRFESDMPGLPAFQLQILEGDYLDHLLNVPYGNNTIIQGVEFNQLGKPVAYWCHKTHPGNGTLLSLISKTTDRVRIPAEDIIHLFKSDRPGQIRGMTWLHAVIKMLIKSQRLDEALLTQAEVQALIAAVIISSADPTKTVLSDKKGKDGSQEIVPGMMIRMKPGDDVKFLTPSGSGDMTPFKKTINQAIAAGCGLSYGSISQDTSNSNYTSMRFGELETRTIVEQIQWNLLIPLFIQPIYNRFVDKCIEAGLVPRNVDRSVTFMPPAQQFISPKDDMEAMVYAAQTGITTPQNILNAQSEDLLEVLQRVKEARDAADKIGIELPIIPKRFIANNNSPNNI